MIAKTNSNSFTTKDWINSTKGIPVFAYNPAEVEIKPSRATGTTQSDFESALKKASRRTSVSRSAAKKK